MIIWITFRLQQKVNETLPIREIQEKKQNIEQPAKARS